MKKYIVLFMIALAGVCTSCEKLFEDVLDAPNKSAMEDKVIFSTPELAESAVMGILQSFMETNSYRGRFIVYYGMNTDFEWFNTTEKPADDKAKLSNYSPTATNGQMDTDNNAWAKFYEGIERANRCIEALRLYGDVEHSKEMAQLLGESLTLRAIFYNDLVRAWGDVPARFNPVNDETMYLAKSDRDSIFIRVLADLEEAASLVAWPNETKTTKTVERVNKSFVKALRARMALYAGGYGQRPDGTVRLSKDPRLSQDKMYQIAKDECLSIIRQGCHQLGSFEQTFRRLCEEDVTAGNESIWEIPFSEGRGRVVFDLGVPHKTTDNYTGQAKGGTDGPLPTAFYAYSPNDLRRDVTCVPYYWEDGKQVPNKMSQWYFGKYRYEWMKRRVTSTNDDGVNWIYMRYADVLLMAAEAINYFEGPKGANNAAQYLKMILDRALPQDEVTAYMDKATASSDAFFDAIVEQRGLEFCGEMLRKADLIRWNLLSKKLEEAKEDLTNLCNKTGRYENLPDKIYYKTADDGESLVLYGLELGQTDAEGAALKYESNKTWAGDAKWTDKIEGLYVNNPDDYQFWPIWQKFIDASNGMLVNDYNYK